MIRVSPFTPLFFNPSTDSTGIGSRYVQTFANTDRILLEILADDKDAEPVVKIENMVTGTVDNVELSLWKMNASDLVYFHTIQMLTNGCYTVSVNGVASEMFRVTDNPNELEDTVLLQYTMRDNRRRSDAIFDINYMRYFFDFRVPGGFKDNGWNFSVDSEQFVTSESDIVSLFAQESTQKTLTVGGSMGCPIWFGELLNRLLCCDYVYIDGYRYCRKESNVPEQTEVIDGNRSFVFRQVLQKIEYLEPEIESENQVLLRRVVNEFRSAEVKDDVAPVKI